MTPILFLKKIPWIIISSSQPNQGLVSSKLEMDYGLSTLDNDFRLALYSDFFVVLVLDEHFMLEYEIKLKRENKNIFEYENYAMILSLLLTLVQSQY